MTNRPDMIDEAITRPGRLEVKIEIGLPDELGRLQILNIHTEKFIKHGLMGEVRTCLPTGSTSTLGTLCTIAVLIYGIL